tara:strand:+ start:312 stop:1238 length:927 start_codon:yes stop_codon:yes gene_type:complete
MVIVIHQSSDTRSAFLYNEKKVREGVASYFYSANTISINPFMYDQGHRWKILHDIEKPNPRVKKKCLHISVNPSGSDRLKLDDKTIRQEVDRMMEHMGYGSQPYFVYKHQDLERVHFHVVSTRIDRTTGKKIQDGYERLKMQKFVQELEQKYQLKQEITAQLGNLKFTASSGYLKRNLESLFKALNQMDIITSKELYDQALGFFEVQVRKAGRGYLVFLTDQNGAVIRHPMKLSAFEERPRFYLVERQEHANKVLRPERIEIPGRDLKSLILKELIRQIQVQVSGETESRTKKNRLRNSQVKKRRMKF